MAKQKTFKDFLIHLGLVFVTLGVILYLFFYTYLPSVTHHGEVIEVPELKTLDPERLASKMERLGLKYKIYDSTFITGAKPMSVIYQYPKAGEKVKSGRTIYVSVSSVNPPMIKMPKLVGSSLKAAEMNIKSYGLVMGNIRYVPNVNDGAVLEQAIGADAIAPGAPVKKGAIVNLVVGNGLGAAKVVVPELVGLTLEEAQNELKIYGLGLGSVVQDNENTSIDNKGKITKQKPAYIPGDTTNKVNIGEIVDVWISGEQPIE